MKNLIRVLIVFALCLGIGACSARNTVDPGRNTPDPTAKSREVPEVVGSSLRDARIALTAVGIRINLIDSDGAPWEGSTDPANSATVVSTDPEAGVLVAAGSAIHVRLDRTPDEAVASMQAASEAAADAQRLATRYTFTCYSDSTSSFSGSETFHKLEDVWSSDLYSSGESCRVEIDGQSPAENVELNADELAVAQRAGARGADLSTPSRVYGEILGLCAKVIPLYESEVIHDTKRKQALAATAHDLCPDAPHSAVLEKAASTVRITDGVHLVGDSMPEGTYRTGSPVNNCYWARTTANGEILANDYTGFAPSGVFVTVYEGEGFESSNCGTWTKSEP